MRAQDETFYNLKRLHAIFALASLALLAVTVWMLSADHRREWKVYQRTFRDRIEPWLTEAKAREEQTKEYTAREDELTAALAKARSSPLPRELVESFSKEARQQGLTSQLAAIEAAQRALSQRPSLEGRQKLLAVLDDVVQAAKLHRENAERRLRFRRADFDEARSSYEAAVGEGRSSEESLILQRRVEKIKQDVAQLTTAVDQAATGHERLVQRVAAMTRGEAQVSKALADHRATLQSLRRALDVQQPGLGKELLRLPLVDAFGRPLAIQQIWLPDLTINYNFRQVARFDRCTTCHQGIDKTQVGSPSLPACLAERVLTVKLATPKEPLKPEPNRPAQSVDQVLESLYGFSLAPEGILDQRAPTLGVVLPNTAAAQADLWTGDVLLKINGSPVADRSDAVKRLTNPVDWGKPLVLEVRRGLPHPYQSHPRLDLLVGSLSPHPVSQFGCTICHAGQGSATTMKFASHTPNDPAERVRWQKQYGWFWNHDWDFPMRPARFVESGCLRCHHDVVDLEPSRRFPDPPAPKLLAGYHLVRQNGCFGCHEIKGMSNTGQRIGPDLRLEPNYHEAALALLADPRLTDQQRSLAQQVVQHPEQPGPRRQLVALVNKQSGPRLADDRRFMELIGLLAGEDPAPGTMRKVGPSLRDTAGKLDKRFLVDWTWQPARFRPATRMPQFFGLHEHLDGKPLNDTERLDAAEVHAVIQYLLAVSQPVAPLAAAGGTGAAPSAERGQRLFALQGCLACHQHQDFPEGKATQGPNLSRLGAKFNAPSGSKWLASWLRDPARHSPRTLMPNPLLEPAAAGDLAAYLLMSRDWQPKKRPPLVEADLDELALLHLSKTYPKKLAESYLRQGIPPALADQVQGDAVELLGPISLEKKIRYVGRRTIRKRGCYGCHDIPGFEAGQGIGPVLSDWGRKQESLLAFEQVHQFLAQPPKNQPSSDEKSSDEAFYREAVSSKRREGFIWQKLRAPRSFDYKKAENKSFHEQLLMGKFTLSADEREAVITFVLGLTAEPPAEKYVCQPDRRRRAIVEGRKVLDKYGCSLCHTLEMERWTFQYDPQEFESPGKSEDYAFVAPAITADQWERSKRVDRCGRGHAEVVGMPRVDPEGKLLVSEGDEEDENGDPLPMLSFTLWEPAAINGECWRVGGADLMLYQHQITGKRPPWGGALARLLYPRALADAKEAGSTASEVEAWGWGPPPLVHEGSMVQPAWLYDYLLEPHVIRPAAVLRMPKYNLSETEAAKLVDYFAAAAGAEFPYHSDPRSRLARWKADQDAHATRYDKALRLLIDRTTYCAKCHLIGDFAPGGETRTILAPNLERVGRRIRPDYIRRWLANPKSVLPYTAMPVNFPPSGQPIGQDLYPGSSLEQLEAVSDLLIHYDEVLKARLSIRAMAEPGTETSPNTARDGQR